MMNIISSFLTFKDGWMADIFVTVSEQFTM